MITYIIKIVLCSAVFIFTYKLLLEKEKMHSFNRGYLLLSMLLSFVIPLITFNYSTPTLPISENEILQTNFIKDYNTTVQEVSAIEKTDYTFLVLTTLYGLISTFFLLRFIINLYKILSKTRNSKTIPFNNSQIVLSDEALSPHSFLNYLFVNNQEYVSGGIEMEILLHECAHIQQRHSYDILLIEILQIVCWFNPFLLMYKKAVQLNHEFLADEAVIKTYPNVSSYQYLLIEKASKSNTYHLSSSFNYLITKQRLIMMTKSKSPQNVLYRQLAIIPVLAIAVFAFSTKSFAQEKPNNVPKAKQIIVPATQDGVSQALLDEYEQILNSKKNKKGIPLIYKFTEAERKRLETIFLSMNEEQQAKQRVIFRPSLPPSPKSVPTQEQIEAWKNDKIYGIWIDDKRVSNSVLNQYKNTDFSYESVSKLEKNAINYGKHYYQISLMTHAGYEKYYQETMATKDLYHMVVFIDSKPRKMIKKS
ncbi:M56 family metallopeptidase [Arcicella lustrica]|uniref:M56 family metallopeptidase n=1 Tax=Arcicella lustrica TaxID=2984196 RepID=A0ABU5SDX9_9BACT|nr:M56 family metallopeptidase [Arcicella sp. DC25W]MEA5425495.1 M56 family metallopeptidase [Arcicella sp. DC25W]